MSRFGPVALEPGVTRGHMWTLVFGAFVTIGMVTGLAAMTPFVLTANLGIPEGDQGKALGFLALVQEIVLILIFTPLGVLADRIGRRYVFVAGFVVLGLGYALYPFATSLTELSLFRIVYAFGIAAVTGMFATLIADYGQAADRGKLTAILGFLNGLGIVCVTLVIARLPGYFAARGASDIDAGRMAMAIAAGLCFFCALVLFAGLKRQDVSPAKARVPFMMLMAEGLHAARGNRRIALAYGSAFVARGDVAIVGLFAIAWGKQAAIAAGMSPSEALSAGTIPFIVAQSAALLWPVVLAVPLDRWPRMLGLGITMLIGALGYCLMVFVGNPLGSAAIPFFMLLGIGQISAFLGAQTLIAKEAPEASRGAVIGAFNFSGAVGILVLSLVGGWLFDHVGPWAPFMLVGVLNGVVGVLCLVEQRREIRLLATH